VGQNLTKGWVGCLPSSLADENIRASDTASKRDGNVFRTIDQNPALAPTVFRVPQTGRKADPRVVWTGNQFAYQVDSRFAPEFLTEN
jgi:hypothetical protein